MSLVFDADNGISISGRKFFEENNVATHNGVPQLPTPNGSIIESGTNSNGTYIKYSDGTAICTGLKFSAGHDWSANPSIQGVFPIEFYEPPFVILSTETDHTPWACAVAISRSAGEVVNTTRFYIRKAKGWVDSGTSISLKYITVGRWRA